MIFLACRCRRVAPCRDRRAAAATPTLKFRELYVRGNDLTDKAKSLEGAEVEMIGYMAPPLKPEIDFFVLTKLPMSTCPFCESEAQWPDDLVLAHPQGIRWRLFATQTSSAFAAASRPASRLIRIPDS